MSLAIGISWGLALFLIGVSLWVRRQRRIRSTFTRPSGSIVRPAKRAATPNASDLSTSMRTVQFESLPKLTRKYVGTEFSPLDGARPYIAALID